MLFERSEGRHLVDVSRLQGSGAFGCDCLSFASAADAEAFAVDPARTDLVARFVEVKSGAVRLTEHEIKAARDYAARYHVYRITFDGGSRSSARLTIVSNPLSYKAALSRECEVRVDEVAGRTCLRLEPVRL